MQDAEMAMTELQMFKKWESFNWTLIDVVQTAAMAKYEFNKRSKALIITILAFLAYQVFNAMSNIFILTTFSWRMLTLN